VKAILASEKIKHEKRLASAWGYEKINPINAINWFHFCSIENDK
jgi:hypothetical protein